MIIYILLIKISILNLLFNLEEIMNEMIDKNSPQRQIKNSSMSEKKYLHHFEVINNSANQSGNKFISTGASSKKYATKLETYSKPQSIIEKIISTEIETQPKGMKVSEDQFVQRPMMIHMNPKVKENVQKTSYFFTMEAQSHHFDHPEQSTLDLPNYLSRILAIPVKKREEKEFVQLQEADQNSHFVYSVPRFSPSPSPPKPPTQSAQQTERQQKLKKIDLLLVQIMREKKRKGLVEDYFQAMEMKLVELLGYILEDQKQYYGLSLTEKMKAVLRNLEDFKGKTIDGQSKINMLRIFFEQFRNLKRQREESTVKHIPQNIQIVQKSKKERKSKIINTHSQKKKAKQNFETMSAGGPRKIDPNSKSIKSYKAEDEWIGSLS